MDFKQGMPVITSLRNQFLRPRHWQQIERLIGKTISKDKSFTLGSLLEMNVSLYDFTYTISSKYVNLSVQQFHQNMSVSMCSEFSVLHDFNLKDL